MNDDPSSAVPDTLLGLSIPDATDLINAIARDQVFEHDQAKYTSEPWPQPQRTTSTTTSW